MESNDSDDGGYLIYTLRAGDGAVQVARAADDTPINRFGLGMLLMGLLCVVGGALSGGPWRGPAGTDRPADRIVIDPDAGRVRKVGLSASTGRR